MAKILMYYGAYPTLLPRKTGGMNVEEILSFVDALILQGGSDISPLQYGEKPKKKEWEGDGIRDVYEIELLHKAMALGKPVLGICRGAQLINVALGGSLYQDIPTQINPDSKHYDAKLYDTFSHEIVIEKNTHLEKLYAKIAKRKVISVHHQAIKELGRALVVEARSKEDGIIEAIRYQGASQKKGEEKAPYVFGIQWHPEYQLGEGKSSFMDHRPIFEDFFARLG